MLLSLHLSDVREGSAATVTANHICQLFRVTVSGTNIPPASPLGTDTVESEVIRVTVCWGYGQSCGCVSMMLCFTVLCSCALPTASHALLVVTHSWDNPTNLLSVSNVTVCHR